MYRVGCLAPGVCLRYGDNGFYRVNADWKVDVRSTLNAVYKFFNIGNFGYNFYSWYLEPLLTRLTGYSYGEIIPESVFLDVLEEHHVPDEVIKKDCKNVSLCCVCDGFYFYYIAARGLGVLGGQGQSGGVNGVIVDTGEYMPYDLRLVCNHGVDFANDGVSLYNLMSYLDLSNTRVSEEFKSEVLVGGFEKLINYGVLVNRVKDFIVNRLGERGSYKDFIYAGFANLVYNSLYSLYGSSARRFTLIFATEIEFYDSIPVLCDLLGKPCKEEADRVLTDVLSLYHRCGTINLDNDKYSIIEHAVEKRKLLKRCKLKYSGSKLRFSLKDYKTVPKDIDGSTRNGINYVLDLGLVCDMKYQRAVAYFWLWSVTEELNIFGLDFNTEDVKGLNWWSWLDLGYIYSAEYMMLTDRALELKNTVVVEKALGFGTFFDNFLAANLAIDAVSGGSGSLHSSCVRIIWQGNALCLVIKREVSLGGALSVKYAEDNEDILIALAIYVLTYQLGFKKCYKNAEFSVVVHNNSFLICCENYLDL